MPGEAFLEALTNSFTDVSPCTKHCINTEITTTHRKTQPSLQNHNLNKVHVPAWNSELGGCYKKAENPLEIQIFFRLARDI